MSLVVLGQAHVCHRCASQGSTCCEPEEGVALAPLTGGDIERIAHETGRIPSDFVVERSVDDDELAALKEEDPALHRVVGSDRKIRSLAKSGRACVFHQAGVGCTLTYESRPLFCRRFPVVRDGARLWVSPGGDCLAVAEAADMPSLLRLLGTTEREVGRLDRTIRREASD